MIDASRFIATSDDRASWLEARRGGVTATEVAKAATPAGFREAVAARANPVDVADNAYMKFGRDSEAWLALWVKQEFGIMPNHWLIASEGDLRFMATPDGLALDHSRISEIKTGGKEVDGPPIQHRRQMQWQMYCTDTEECIYAFMLRREVDGVFVPAWLEPKTWVVERDERMVGVLEETAHRLLDEDERLVAA